MVNGSAHPPHVRTTTKEQQQQQQQVTHKKKKGVKGKRIESSPLWCDVALGSIDGAQLSYHNRSTTKPADSKIVPPVLSPSLVVLLVLRVCLCVVPFCFLFVLKRATTNRETRSSNSSQWEMKTGGTSKDIPEERTREDRGGWNVLRGANVWRIRLSPRAQKRIRQLAQARAVVLPCLHFRP